MKSAECLSRYQPIGWTRFDREKLSDGPVASGGVHHFLAGVWEVIGNDAMKSACVCECWRHGGKSEITRVRSRAADSRQSTVRNESDRSWHTNGFHPATVVVETRLIVVHSSAGKKRKESQSQTKQTGTIIGHCCHRLVLRIDVFISVLDQFSAFWTYFIFHDFYRLGCMC